MHNKFSVGRMLGLTFAQGSKVLIMEILIIAGRLKYRTI